MTFAPTLESDRSKYHVRVERQEFPVGVAGVRLSLSDMARRIREGGRTPSMRAFAEMVVRQKIPPAQHTSTREAAAVMLGYVIDNIRYRSDPPLTEWIQSAPITLCINGAPMCIPVGDCDDLVVALGSLMMAYGIPVRIVKQTFGAADQEHVLLQFQQENGDWVSADPTPRSPSLQVGQQAIASYEDYIDPLDPSQIGMVAGTPDAEFIGVGSLRGSFEIAEVRNVDFINGAWQESKYGRTWRHVGGTWREVGFGDTPAVLPSLTPTVNPAPSGAAAGGAAAGIVGSDPFMQCQVDLDDMVTAVIAAGDTYLHASPPEYAQAVSAYQAAGQAGVTVVGPEIDLAGAARVTSPRTYRAWTINATLAKTNASSSATLQDAQAAQAYAMRIQAELQTAIGDGRAALRFTPPGKVPGERQTSLATIAAWTVGAGIVVGAIYSRRSRR